MTDDMHAGKLDSRRDFSRRDIFSRARALFLLRPRSLLVARHARRRLLASLAVVACLLFVAHERARLSSDKQQQCVADSHDAARLLETGRAAKVRESAAAPTEIKIVSYNMRWRGGEELRAITKLLRDDPFIGGADIVGLQEVDRGRRRSGVVNAARQMAEELGLNYAWAAPPSEGTKHDDREAGEDETGVAILSPYPLTEITRLVLPNPGHDCQRRAAIGATVHIGKRDVRVYSVHAETRIAVERKVEQWRAILDDLKSHTNTTRVVVLGDFNTIKGKDVSAARKLFTEAGFSTPFPDDDMTWQTFMVALKLDWLWLRGLDATAHGIRRTVTYSDHYPLWTTAKY
jgi:endonuclease/exonuclease/phosphatase family metal-dependent hydrolase